MPNPHIPSNRFMAHSYMEIHLFFQVTVCESCTSGPLEPQFPDNQPRKEMDTVIAVPTTCSQCQHQRIFSFDIPKKATPVSPDALTHINLSSAASTMIDLAQWLTLDQILYEASKNESEAKLARHKALKASFCLEEALKFFDDPDNDLPPAESFFTETSRSRFLQTPHLFARQRILALHAQRPAPTQSELSPP